MASPETRGFYGDGILEQCTENGKFYWKWNPRWVFRYVYRKWILSLYISLRTKKKASKLAEIARQKLQKSALDPPSRCMKRDCPTGQNPSQVHAMVEQAHFKVRQSVEYYKTITQQLNDVSEERTQIAREFAERAERLQSLSVEDVRNPLPRPTKSRCIRRM